MFESIYEKLNTSSNKAQNEKIEQDLKKEIKKLQRYRDQIKTWAASNDIKDKKPLMDNRRLIEVQMEKFKACEKEIKTKQFSKEGLSAVAKLDPKEREKLETGQWLSQSVDELERQVEQAEAEIEGLNAQVKKGKNNSGKNERLEEVEHMIERHKWHTDKLEQVLRLLENGGLETEQVIAIKEDVQYYIESNQDVDFAEDDNIYDELNLGDEPHSEEDEDNSDDEAPTSPVLSVPKSPEQPKAKIPPGKPKIESVKSVPPKVTPTVAKSVPKPTSETILPQPIATDIDSPKDEVKKPNIPVLKYASAAATGANIRDKAPRIEKLPPPHPPVAPPGQTLPSTPALPSATLPNNFNSPRPVPPISEAAKNDTVLSRTASPATTQASVPQMMHSHVTESDQPNYHIPSCLVDLIPEEHTLTEEEREEMLETSFKSCPGISDGERPYHYIPKEPFPTPPYYPSMPLDIFNVPEAMEKIEIDTLFYIFYYQKGTYQQYLASRELKKQAWRFHKRYLTWFQRHEEPKDINDEYESGTYRYFDFEASWVQRKKNDFKFQYAYLEEERGEERV